MPCWLAIPEDWCPGDLQLPLRQRLGSAGSCVTVPKDRPPPIHLSPPQPSLTQGALPTDPLTRVLRSC